MIASPATLRGALKTVGGDRATAIRHDEGEFLFNFVREHSLARTLEVGFAYGFSSAYILSATSTTHVAIDPHPEQYANLGFENLAQLGLADRLHLERDVAHVVLPRLLHEGRRFDFAFVDGDHKFDTTFVEFYYLDLLVDVGGYVLFHDAWMRSIQHVASWIRHNKANYRFIDTRLSNLILVEKVDTDGRRWDHFADFGLRRPLWRGVASRMRSRLRRAGRR